MNLGVSLEIGGCLEQRRLVTSFKFAFICLLISLPYLETHLQSDSLTTCVSSHLDLFLAKSVPRSQQWTATIKSRLDEPFLEGEQCTGSLFPLQDRNVKCCHSHGFCLGFGEEFLELQFSNAQRVMLNASYRYFHRLRAQQPGDKGSIAHVPWKHKEEQSNSLQAMRQYS